MAVESQDFLCSFRAPPTPHVSFSVCPHLSLSGHLCGHEDPVGPTFTVSFRELHIVRPAHSRPTINSGE